jgi:regulator of sigma E protease
MFSALISVFVLGWLVFVHELGHFLVARAAGVRVLRFSLGFGPKLLTFRRGHTEYTLSAIPFGGYVKMAGEQRAQLSHQPWEFLSRSIGTRARIIIAGPLVNYVVAVIGIWAMFMIGFPELEPVIGRLIEELPAQAAGMQIGDRVLAVDGQPVRTWEEMTARIHAAPGRALALRIERAGALQTLTVTPQAKTITDPFGRPQHVGLIGISPSGAFTSQPVGPVAAVGRAVKLHNEWVAQTFLGLWSMVAGRLSVKESVTGPIGILVITSEAARHGVAPLLYFVSLMSLSLAIFNVFPLPILDGGHLFFLLLEKLRGNPVSVKVQERAAQVSLALLVALVLVICVNDLDRFGVLTKMREWIRP